MARRISIASERSILSELSLFRRKYATLEDVSTYKDSSVSFFHLFKYATKLDILNIFVASTLAIVSSVCNIIFSVMFGRVTGTIVDYVIKTTDNKNQTDVNVANEKLMEGLNWFLLSTCLLGGATLILTYSSTLLFNYSALRQLYRIRQLFLSKMLNHDISWYDEYQTGDFASRVSNDLKMIEEAIGEKVGSFLFYQFTFASGVVLGLVLGWELALVCLIPFPIATMLMSFVFWVSTKLVKQEVDSYSEAGAIAEEAIGSIRTVVAFGGEQKEVDRYKKQLLHVKKNNLRRSTLNGVNSALMWFFTYASYSLSFWYGIKLIVREKNFALESKTYDVPTMITVFYTTVMATWYFSISIPFLETFGLAKGAASKIFAIIETSSKINASKTLGIVPEKIEGQIVFDNNQFYYPNRTEVKILKWFSLTIKAGETIALVGSQGCGKSTCINLIQRLYDTTFGNIYLDDNALTDLNLTWLRQQIGVVAQDTVLFETTIAENICMGLEQATQEDIEKAAKTADAHVFISSLPQGYNTIIGERGIQLSAGEKQRIVIARALVRKPAILILDEATSELDTDSESAILTALNEDRNRCTKIIVSHRLSTVKQADRIVVMAYGRVVEQGTHDELISRKREYHRLFMAQLPEYMEERPNFVDKPKVETSTASSNTVRTSERVEGTLVKKSLFWSIMKLNAPEWWIIVIGCISCFVVGASLPIYSILFGEIFGLLSLESTADLQSGANTLSLYLLYLAIATAAATMLQVITLAAAGENLTLRLRCKLLKAVLSQEIAWFDNKDNNVGTICSWLCEEAANVQGATGQRIGTILNGVLAYVLAVGASLYFDWRIALTVLCFSPLLIFFMYLEIKIETHEGETHNESLQRSTKVAVEAVSKIRTIASLGCEDTFLSLYIKELVPYQNAAKRNMHFRGVIYGVSRSLVFFAYSAALYYGAVLVKDGKIDYKVLFIVSEALITSSWTLANAYAFTPNFRRGLVSASRIFNLLNRVPNIRDGSGDIDEKWEQGNLYFDKVYFSYPVGPTTAVLRGLNLSILQGQKIALVGPNGCGKSTIVQLLERFYDPTFGRITSDNKDIRDMSLSALRSHLAIISQNPNLFSISIADNIAYGDNSRTVSREEILEAARKANVHSFVRFLPTGYDTKVGQMGIQLSEGQKQRIAIARALIKNPKVLVLDEATSALDSDTEKVVQNALNRIKSGCTCITIANRLSLIKDSDIICVINRGRVVEMGTHSELISLTGMYYNLYNLGSEDN